jgi:hypothetical protein
VQAGSDHSWNLYVTNKGGSVATWSVSPTINAALSFSSGTFTGVSTASGTYGPYTVTATNSTGSSTASVTITVTPYLLAPQVIIDTATVDMTVGTPMANPFIPRNTGGLTSSWSITPTLPNGLVFNTQTGEITGFPNEALASQIETITATNSAGPSTGNFTLTIGSGQTLVFDSPSYFNMDLGLDVNAHIVEPSGSAIIFSTSSPDCVIDGATGHLNYTGTTLPATCSVVATAAAVVGTYLLGTATQVITIYPPASIILTEPSNVAGSVGVSGSLSITLTDLAAALSPTFQWYESGTVVTAISGAIESTLSFSSLALADAGSYFAVVTIDAGGGAISIDTSTVGVLTVSMPSAPSVSLSSATLSGTVGTAFTTFTPINNGGPSSAWTISPSLPAGLVFDPTTGSISGTPTAVRTTTTFTITATNGGTQTSSATFTLTVAAAPSSDPVYTPPAPTITPTTPPTMTSGTPTTFPIVAPNATSFSVSGGTLPAGLTLNPATGVITGTPTGSGTYSFTITATNTYGLTSTVTFSGTIAAAPTTTTPTTPTTPGSGTTGTGSTGSGTGSTNTLPTLAPITPPPAVATAPVGGNILVLVNGKTTAANLKPNPADNGYVLNAPGWNLNLLPLDSAGNPVPLNGNSQIFLASNSRIGVAGDGFLPNSPVNVYLFSNPVLLGTVLTDKDGKFKADFPVLSSIDAGNHTIQVNGFSPSKDIRSASVGLLVQADANASNASGVSMTIIGATAVVPFAQAKFQAGKSQIAILKSYRFKKRASVLITGYASKTSGEDDIRVSLDRALEVKNALAKLHPDLVIKAQGGGVKKNSRCAKYVNQCAVVKIIK